MKKDTTTLRTTGGLTGSDPAPSPSSLPPATIVVAEVPKEEGEKPKPVLAEVPKKPKQQRLGLRSKRGGTILTKKRKKAPVRKENPDPTKTESILSTMMRREDPAKLSRTRSGRSSDASNPTGNGLVAHPAPEKDAEPSAIISPLPGTSNETKVDENTVAAVLASDTNVHVGIPENKMSEVEDLASKIGQPGILKSIEDALNMAAHKKTTFTEETVVNGIARIRAAIQVAETGGVNPKLDPLKAEVARLEQVRESQIETKVDLKLKRDPQPAKKPGFFASTSRPAVSLESPVVPVAPLTIPAGGVNGNGFVPGHQEPMAYPVGYEHEGETVYHTRKTKWTERFRNYRKNRPEDWAFCKKWTFLIGSSVTIALLLLIIITMKWEANRQFEMRKMEAEVKEREAASNRTMVKESMNFTERLAIRFIEANAGGKAITPTNLNWNFDSPPEVQRPKK